MITPSREGAGAAANTTGMRVIARGQFKGQNVELTWSDGAINGPAFTVAAVRKIEAGLAGTALAFDHPEDILERAFLTRPRGFEFIARILLGEDVELEFPDGEPPPMSSSIRLPATDERNWAGEPTPRTIPNLPSWGWSLDDFDL